MNTIVKYRNRTIQFCIKLLINRGRNINYEYVHHTSAPFFSIGPVWIEIEITEIFKMIDWLTESIKLSNGRLPYQSFTGILIGTFDLCHRFCWTFA